MLCNKLCFGFELNHRDEDRPARSRYDALYIKMGAVCVVFDDACLRMSDVVCSVAVDCPHCVLFSPWSCNKAISTGSSPSLLPPSLNSRTTESVMSTLVSISPSQTCSIVHLFIWCGVVSGCWMILLSSEYSREQIHTITEIAKGERNSTQPSLLLYQSKQKKLAVPQPTESIR